MSPSRMLTTRLGRGSTRTMTITAFEDRPPESARPPFGERLASELRRLAARTRFKADIDRHSAIESMANVEDGRAQDARRDYGRASTQPGGLELCELASSTGFEPLASFVVKDLRIRSSCA